MVPLEQGSSIERGDRRAAGIDVGGSTIKGGVVDLDEGTLIGERGREPAPERFDPEAVIGVIAALAARLKSEGPIGVGFPAIVKDGALLTDPTSMEWPGWKGLNLEEELYRITGRAISVANDADAAALAEQSFGAAAGDDRNTVLVLTLGTGIGSGLISNGRLFPNIELGRIYLPGDEEVVEEVCSARIRTEQDLSWDDYSERLQRFLDHIERIVAPDLIVIGGAISAEAEKFMSLIRTRARLTSASLLNDAGIIGAAMLVEGNQQERADL